MTYTTVILQMSSLQKIILKPTKKTPGKCDSHVGNKWKSLGSPDDDWTSRQSLKVAIVNVLKELKEPVSKNGRKVENNTSKM